MAEFFPFQRLRIDYKVEGTDEHAYQGPGEYVRPVVAADEDFDVPEDEPMHYVRIVLGNDTSEHIFPESAIAAAPQRDLGGLMDRVHEMLDQIGPMMRYLHQEIHANENTKPIFAGVEDEQMQRLREYQGLRERLRKIAHPESD